MPDNRPVDSLKDKRLPKQFGDFAESLVMYVFGEYKSMRVALVDHIGADIIASKPGGNSRYAISVKGRNFPKAESKGYHFGTHDIEMLRDFADSFALTPAVAFVFTDGMEGDEKIRMFVVLLDTMERLAASGACSYISASSRGGVHLNYGITSRYNHLQEIRDSGFFDYTELTFDVLDEIFTI